MRRLPKKQAPQHTPNSAPFSASSQGPRIAIYHRVSTLDQDKTLARRELESWASRQQGQITMLVEESASGAWNARPGLQRVLDATVWPPLAGGCHLTRDTERAITEAGFEIARIRRFSFQPCLLPAPISPQIVGTAVVTAPAVG